MKITPVLKLWLPIATAITLVCGIIYVTVQQTYRSNANDPQNQMAESAAAIIRTNEDARALLTSQPVDIATTLRPFMMIYDERGNPIASDALLDGKIPLLPSGVLDYTQAHGSDAITWQPRAGVRNALVILPVQNSFKGFVVVGRSLRLAEERESILIKSIAFGWIASLILLLFVITAIEFLTVRIPIAGNA